MPAAHAHRVSAGGLAMSTSAMLLWGAQLPIAKGAMADIDAYSLTVVRYGLAVLAFVVLLVWHEGRAALSFEDQTPRVLFNGVVGMAGSALLVFIGLAMTQPEVAVILISLQPTMTAIAQWLIRGQRPARFTLASIAVAFVGVVLVVTRGGAAFADTGVGSSPRELLGDAMVLAGAAAWVAYTMVSEGFRGWSPLRISTLTSLTALPPILLAWGVAASLGAAPLSAWSAMPGHGWRLLYVSMLGVVAGMFLWNAGARRIGPLNAMLVLNLMPVVTFAIRAVQGARFAPLQLVGAGLVVGALIANSLYARHRQQRAIAGSPSPTTRDGP